MDYFILALSLLFTWTLIHALLSPPRGGADGGRKLPPGPTPLPIIGNLHKLGKKPHKSLAELASIHGPIISLKLGRITTVVISSSAMAREVLQKQDLAFCHRSIPDAVRALDHCKFSVVWLPNTGQWRSLRKILNTHVFAGNKLYANQHLRSRKVRELIARCRKSSQAGDAVDIGEAAFTTSLNVLSNTIFSKDLANPSSDSAKEFKQLVWTIMEESGRPNLVDFFPVLKRIDPQGIRRRATICSLKILKIFQGLIDERLELRKMKKDKDSNGDVLDILLSVSEENHEMIDRTHIEKLCMDLFIAGTDTTASTLEWAMTEVLRDPKTLKKAKAELGEVIGEGNPVEEEDISRLPYLNCIVKETLRIHPPTPLLIPRKVEEDVEVCGFTVPKGARVLLNAWAIGRDPTTWKNPLKFSPERFWESGIDVKGTDFELIPFGAGRRICPGLPLAARMVPVMLGSLINSFDWKVEGGVAAEEMEMDDKFGITLQKAHPLRAVPISLT